MHPDEKSGGPSVQLLHLKKKTDWHFDHLASRSPVNQKPFQRKRATSTVERVLNTLAIVGVSGGKQFATPPHPPPLFFTVLKTLGESVVTTCEP